MQSVPEQLIALIIERPNISRAQLSKQLNVSERQLRNIMEALRQEKRLVREGGD